MQIVAIKFVYECLTKNQNKTAIIHTKIEESKLQMNRQMNKNTKKKRKTKYISK